MPGPLNLTSQKISFTYPRLIQTDGTGGYYDGLGDPVNIGGGGTGNYEFSYTGSPPPTPTNLGARWLDSDTGIEYVWVYDGTQYLWMQPTQLGGVKYQASVINTATATVSFAYEYYGVTYMGGICTVTLPSGVSANDGQFITIADEVGGISSYGRGIVVQGTGGQLINGNTSVNMKLNYMSLTFLYRNSSWKTI